MARRDRPAEQGEDREMPRRDRGAGMDDEDVSREGDSDVRGTDEDELDEGDEFDDDEPEEFEEDEEEGIR